MMLLGAAGACLLPARAFAARGGAKALAFHHLHTGERLSATFWHDGAYDAGALDAINHVLRDHYSGQVTEIEPGLLDLLCDINHALETPEPFEVISAYRSPQTNERLRKEGHGVAKKSLHMKGMAIDIRVPGRDLAMVRATARGLKRGGVGYYPRSDFVHVDIGRVRFW